MYRLLSCLLAFAAFTTEAVAADLPPPASFQPPAPNQTIIDKRALLVKFDKSKKKKDMETKAEAAASAALKPVLETRYAALKKAKARNDEKALKALLTPDFTSVDSDNKSYDIAQSLSMLSKVANDPQKESAITLDDIEVKGDTATVDQHYDMHTQKLGETDGKIHKIHLVSESTDTWKKSGKVWLLQKTVVESTDLAVNDRIVVHKVRPR